ncbi:MAG: MOSC domain-containing protein [Xanthobacteraceae bacterium]|nr:MOSC domain-containing protein [Xanthobacteraceae bacterium]
MLDAPSTLAGLYRYPVKGLSPEELSRTTLEPRKTLPSDRRYAIENGPIGFDPDYPKYFPKIRFLMLMRNERLAALRTRYDDQSHVLSIMYNNAAAVRGDLETVQGRSVIEEFFAANFAGELRGPPRILAAPGHSFSDVAAKVVSLINLASVAAIEDTVGRAVDPLRFRGNLYVKGWPAWRERELMGQELKIRDVRLKVLKEIVRCAAVNVDPTTAERNLDIPHMMSRTLGHDFCGIYCEVVTGGEIAPGDAIGIVG